MRKVVNPGHSEYDPGAIGPTGLQENHVVRGVANYLKPEGYEIKRQGRFLLPLLLALRANRPDILVSLHCNAGTDDRHECQVYYWGADPNVDRHEESLRLAGIMAEAAHGCFAEMAFPVPFPIRRERASGKVRWFAPGIVKNTARMAVIVVELGFISDPHVEAAMRTEEWRRRAATVIDLAIRRWVETLTGRKER